jgi:hypothetical protein
MRGPKREDYLEAEHGDGSIPPGGTPTELKGRAARRSLRNKLSVQLYFELCKRDTRAEQMKFIDSSKLTKPPSQTSSHMNRSRLLLFELKKWDYVDLLSHAYLPVLKRLSD